ncbi:MAG TPA: nuclear transport factor 2 family protein [Cyclobacteriaceae bacterium]|nr:nuclear transport factor 2 family protein [Cyclobacteriaceae bacterium]
MYLRILFSSLFIFVLFACNEQPVSSDAAAITDLINSAYVDGTQNRGDLNLVRKGFHPEFSMFRQIDGKIIKVSLDEWIAAIEKRIAENPEPLKELTTGKIISIDITEESALAKVELHKSGQLIFTDYLALYKFKNEGWRIISKTYYKH